MTIKELAKIAGLNDSTVSRSLNDSPLISEKTKARVRKLAEEHNFELNAGARSLRTRKTGTIGVIFPPIQSRVREMQYLGSLMNSLRFTIEREQYDSIITFPRNPETGRSNIGKLIRQRKVDGLLLVIEDVDDEDWRILRSSGIPFVSLHFKWQSGRQEEIDHIYPDNFRGGYLAADCLLRAGCKNIITLTEGGGRFEFAERTRGWEAALAARGISPAADSVFRGETGFDFGYGFIMDNRRLLRDIDGIFAQADMTAIGAIEAMKELGIRVPQDIPVVGYDDIDIDYFFRPRLTTIHQPREEYTAAACRKLVELIEGGGQTPRLSSVIEPELLIRESCVITDGGGEPL